jgi:hypothetical protein
MSASRCVSQADQRASASAPVPLRSSAGTASPSAATSGRASARVMSLVGAGSLDSWRLSLPAGSNRLRQGSGESAEALATAEDPAATEEKDVGPGPLESALPAGSKDPAATENKDAVPAASNEDNVGPGSSDPGRPPVAERSINSPATAPTTLPISAGC